MVEFICLDFVMLDGLLSVKYVFGCNYIMACFSVKTSIIGCNIIIRL